MELPWTGERYVPHMRGQIALEHLHRYAIAAELASGKRVLDVACGEGYGSELIARRAQTVTGVDNDNASIAHARSKYSNTSLSFIEADATQIPLPDDSVDFAVSFETLEHLNDHERFITELKRLLTPQGMLLISSPNIEEYSLKTGYSNPFHKRELNLQQFHSLLSKSFEHVYLFGQKCIYGSLIVPTIPDTHSFETYLFKDLPASLEKREGIQQPVFFLALCSNSPLPSPFAGLCEQDVIDCEFAQIQHRDASALASQLAASRAETSRINALLSSLQTDNSKLQTERNKARKKLKALRSSVFWKATFPLRAVTAQITRLVRFARRSAC